MARVKQNVLGNQTTHVITHFRLCVYTYSQDRRGSNTGDPALGTSRPWKVEESMQEHFIHLNFFGEGKRSQGYKPPTL